MSKIRPCTLADLTTLQKISVETFIDTFAAQNTPEDMRLFLESAYTIEKLKAEMETSGTTFYFIYNHDQLAGYLKINQQTALTEQIGKHSLEIERIYIRPEFKRKGLGKKLILYALHIAEVNTCSDVWLGVWEHNQNALAFYKALGFRKVGDHIFTLGNDPQTDWIMKKELM